ncbi:MAG TPA: restriction endonuclease subunit S [Mycobacteriales bacterium]|nr:restriction endonuclease subunit S [Mycobacteriales bacterium]
MRRFSLKPGDFIVSCSGTIGRIFQIPEGAVEGIINQALLKIKINSEIINPRYFLNYFRWDKIQSHILDSTQGGAIQNLVGMSLFRATPIALPSMPEQIRIAEALDDSGRAITTLERLIAKKQAIKQGMMQQLLTGKTRLPGFTDEWSESTLSDLAHIISGGTPRSSVPAYWNGGLAWCTPTDITREKGRYLRTTERTISREGLEKSATQFLPKGSLLLCTRATIGELKISLVPITTNQGFKSLVPKPGVSSEFLYYKMLTLKDELTGYGTGSTFLEVSRRDVAGLRLTAPKTEEQYAIAVVLSDADDEIDAFRRRLAKAKAIKQGMMQELLTGRTRLPVKETPK